MRWTVVLVVTTVCAQAWAEPQVVNPSFEEDKYDTYPGYAPRDGSGITGWEYEGNVGINPWWGNAKQRKQPNHPFSDNGRIPHGKQVALMQGACTLKQRVEGFKAGKKYRVIYRENARAYNKSNVDTRVKVTLGGEIIVSAHALEPVDAEKQHRTPYDRVESAVFTAGADGAYDLVFTTMTSAGVTALIDEVRIVEVG